MFHLLLQAHHHTTSPPPPPAAMHRRRPAGLHPPRRLLHGQPRRAPRRRRPERGRRVHPPRHPRRPHLPHPRCRPPQLHPARPGRLPTHRRPRPAARRRSPSAHRCRDLHLSCPPPPPRPLLLLPRRPCRLPPRRPPTHPPRPHPARQGPLRRRAPAGLDRSEPPPRSRRAPPRRAHFGTGQLVGAQRGADAQVHCRRPRCTIVLSIHQPRFRILAAIDKILLLSKGAVVHHGSLPSLQSFLHSKNLQVPLQLNALEHAMQVLHQLDQPTPPPAKRSQPSSPQTEHDPVEIRYRSSSVLEVFILYNRFWKIIYRTRQLLLTNGLEDLLVGFFLGTIYVNVGLDKQGIDKRLGLFAFTVTFLLSSTTETLPIFVSERRILLRESSSGVYRLSSHLIANTLVFLPYLLALAITYSFCVCFLVGLCSSWQAFAYFVLVMWVILLMANSFVLFLSSIAPNYIAGTSLVTVFLACFFLFSGYFISKDSMPKYWLFMH